MAGSITKRGDVWHIRWDAGRDGMGRRIQKSLSCKGMNKREAESLLAQKLADVRDGKINDFDLTVEQFFKQFLGAVRSQVAQTTFELYALTAKAHIIPRWGGVRIAKVQPAEVAAWYTYLLKHGNRVTGGTLDPKSVRNIHGLFHHALAEAVQWGVLHANPLDRVSPPKQISKEVDTATPVEIILLRDALDLHPLRLPFLLILATGMRRGEVCGLKWENVEGARITIRQTAAMVQGGMINKPPKSGQPRSIPVPGVFARELGCYRMTSRSEWVCPNEEGLQMSPRELSRQWKSLTRELGITVRLHQLRHTHATGLIMAGLPAKVVQERLGHSDIRITLNTYTHVMETIQDKAAEVVGELWFGEENEA